MADEKAAKAKAEPEAEKVDRDRLIAAAHKFFGVGPHVVAGALADYGHGDSDLTVEEAQAAIDKFLKRKAKKGA
jgi:hypothetical protein